MGIQYGDLETLDMKLGTSQVDKVMLGADQAWPPPYVGPPSPITFLDEGTLIAGEDFPWGVELSICLIGGGNSGAWDQGGEAGEVVSTVHTLARREEVVLTLGAGGGEHSGGSASSFGAYSTASGGDGTIFGQAESVTTCAGTANNGDNYNFGGGGGSCGYSNGGNGGYDDHSAGGGGRGSGGGGVDEPAEGATEGFGGQGLCIVSWT